MPSWIPFEISCCCGCSLRDANIIINAVYLTLLIHIALFWPIARNWNGFENVIALFSLLICLGIESASVYGIIKGKSLWVVPHVVLQCVLVAVFGTLMVLIIFSHTVIDFILHQADVHPSVKSLGTGLIVVCEIIFASIIGFLLYCGSLGYNYYKQMREQQTPYVNISNFNP